MRYWRVMTMTSVVSMRISPNGSNSGVPKADPPMMRSIELWPTPISFLKLTDFRFREGKQVCEYY